MILPLSKNARSALLIIDMQEYFFRKAERRKNLGQVVNNINKLIKHFDICSLPVYHVVSRFQADGSDWDLKMRMTGESALIIGAEGSAILSDINVLSNHTTIVKNRYSAFFGTNLAELLKIENIDRVVVIGGYTHYCVNATIFDAYCYDFVPCIITNAVISHLEEESNVMIERMRRNGFHIFKTDDFIKGVEYK